HQGSALGMGPMPGLMAVAVEPMQDEAGFHLLRAGRIGFAAAYRYDGGWISAEVDVQPALHRPAIDVNRKAVVNARLGGYRLVSPIVALGAGLFTDRSPDAISESLLSGSGDFYGGSAGVEFSNRHLLADSEAVD